MNNTVILLVDSRENMLRRVEEALKAMDEPPRILTAAHGEKALQLLPLQPVRILVTAGRLSDMLADELIERARERNPEMPVVAYVNPGDLLFRQLAAIKQVRCAEYAMDPEPIIKQLRVAYQMTQEKDEQGQTRSLAETIQKAAEDRATIQITVVSKKGLGVVECENGELMHAHTRSTQGEEALTRMLSWSEASLEVVHIMKCDSKSIFKSWAALQQEAEQKKKENWLPPPPSPLLKELPEVAKKKGALKRRAKKRSKRVRPPKQRHKKNHFLPLLLLLLVLLSAAAVWVLTLSPHADLFIQDISRFLPHDFTEPGPETDTPKPLAMTTSMQRYVPFPKNMQDDSWSIFQAQKTWLATFQESGSAVVLSEAAFQTLNMGPSGYVEIVGPHGQHLGAQAIIQRRAKDHTLYLRESMVKALDMDPGIPFSVAVRAITWSDQAPLQKELTFDTTRFLPDRFGQHWYAAGLSLRAMRQLNLKPGSYVIVRGPTGYQSAKIQLMDRGGRDEIWLNKAVRTAVGVHTPKDRVVLYPKEKGSDSTP